MSLLVTFHRAASAEFIEASVWYERKRFGLGLEFMAEINRCVFLASERPLEFSPVRDDIRRVIANRFPYSVFFVRRSSVSLSWRYFMAAEIPLFGWIEPSARLNTQPAVFT